MNNAATHCLPSPAVAPSVRSHPPFICRDTSSSQDRSYPKIPTSQGTIVVRHNSRAFRDADGPLAVEPTPPLCSLVRWNGRNRRSGHSQSAKLAHCLLQRTGKPESLEVHSSASILAGRGEKNGVAPGSQDLRRLHPEPQPGEFQPERLNGAPRVVADASSSPLPSASCALLSSAAPQRPHCAGSVAVRS